MDAPRAVTQCPHCSGAISISVTSVSTITGASAAKPQPSIPNGLVPVDNLVTCRDCGEENLAWQKSKLGKNYLCRGLAKDGRFYASRREFHDCPARTSRY